MLADPHEKLGRRAGNYCFVYGCKSALRLGQSCLAPEEKTHIFSFPKQSPLLDVWVYFCGRNDEKGNLLHPGVGMQGIRHLHFAQNDIIKQSISKQKSRRREGDLKYWRLVKGAVPSISPPDKTYVGKSEAVCPSPEKQLCKLATEEAQHPEMDHYSQIHPPNQEEVTVGRKTHYCFVYGCDMATRAGEGKVPANKMVHIFTFPSDEARREVWVQFCGRGDEQGNLLYPTSRTQGLCHHHFTDSDIITKSKSKRKPRQGQLKNWRALSTAIPTLFPHGKKQAMGHDEPGQYSQADILQSSSQKSVSSDGTVPVGNDSVRIKFEQVTLCCFVAA